MRLLVLGALSLVPAVAAARPGDLSEPLGIVAFPFVHASTTAGRAAAIDRYGCAPATSEAGPEVVYEARVGSSGALSAWVDGDGGAVDVDVHILSSLDVDASHAAPACLARDNRGTTARVTAGRYWIVVDTFQGAERAGPYRLRVDFQPDDEWYVRPIAEGVTLRTKRYTSLFGATQTAAVLEVDLSRPGVRIRPLGGGACARTSALARAAGAVAAVNGGFFDTRDCTSLSLLKIDGRLLARNARTRTAFGIDPEGHPMLSLIAAGADWPEAVQAVGGVPRIVSGGAPDVRTAEEGASSSFETTRHPRTAVGLRAGDRVLLATVDGRTAAGAGMTLPELAQWMVWLGAEEALNLDGGGSTTLWADGEPFGGVVNHPSDNGLADHYGERAVSHAIGVFAPRLDRDAIWLTTPPAGPVRAGELWIYEAVAADPEGAPVRYAVEPARARLRDRGDGTARVEFRPEADDATRGEVTLRLEAAVQGSRSVVQSIRLAVIAGRDGGAAGADVGTTLPDGGAAGADAGTTLPDGGAAGADAGTTLPDGGAPLPPTDAGVSPPDGGGCGSTRAGSPWALPLLILVVVLVSHRTRGGGAERLGLRGDRAERRRAATRTATR